MYQLIGHRGQMRGPNQYENEIYDNELEKN